MYPQKKKKIVPRHRYKVNNPLKDPPLYIDIVLNYSFLIVSLYLTMNEIACRVYNMGNYHRASLLLDLASIPHQVYSCCVNKF